MYPDLGPIKPNVDRKFRLPRMWSNRELVKFASLFEGDVVNVSAGEDVDKEGHQYRDYFSSCKTYSTTNHAPGSYRGFAGRPREILLDLCQPLPVELVGGFDTVFNHTTLEHVVDFPKAIENLCQLSSDLVVLVVPFLQAQHETSSYRDYWRFTPAILEHHLNLHGLSVIYESANQHPEASIYIFQIASKNPARWADRIPTKRHEGQPIGHWLGDSSGNPQANAPGFLRTWRRRKSA